MVSAGDLSSIPVLNDELSDIVFKKIMFVLVSQVCAQTGNLAATKAGNK